MFQLAPRDDTPFAGPRFVADDLDIVARIRQGDAQAFERVFKMWAGPLCDYALRLLHSRDEAEDVVQDVLLSLWRGREALTLVGPLERYLYLAVRNRCFDRLKHDRVARQWADGEQGEAQDAGAAASSNERSEILAAVERALAELPERRRAVCRLRWVEQLTYAEIAERLGIAPKTVENQIARSLAHVRQRLRDLLD